jgi:uncharacterized ferredoxin-like protein
MSAAMAIRCGCCGVTTDASVALFDKEIQAHVCPECRLEMKQAVAQLSRSYSADGDRINIRGCYTGRDAGDNQVTIPPPTEL